MASVLDRLVLAVASRAASMASRAANVGSRAASMASRAASVATHRDPVLLVVDAHFVFLPEDGGLWVSPGRDTLQDGRLSRCHHHVCGVLSEVITQH